MFMYKHLTKTKDIKLGGIYTFESGLTQCDQTGRNPAHLGGFQHFWAGKFFDGAGWAG